MFCTSSSHCQCFAHAFFFASQRSDKLASSSSFSRICAPLLQGVGFVILCKSPARAQVKLISPSQNHFFCQFKFVNFEGELVIFTSSWVLNSLNSKFISSLSINYFSLLRTTSPGLPLPFFQPKFPALVHFALAQTPPFFHLFSIFFHSNIWLFLHLFDRPSWYHLLFFKPFIPLPCDKRSCTTSSGAFRMTSSFKVSPSILLRSMISSIFCSAFHCAAIWSPSRQLSSSSSSSICEQSNLRMTLSPTGLFTASLSRSCALSFSLISGTTSWTIWPLILLSSPSSSTTLLLFLSLLSSFLATFLRCTQAAPSAASARSIPLILSLF